MPESTPQTPAPKKPSPDAQAAPAPPASMTATAAGSLGSAVLQRKIAQRLQRKPADSGGATETGGGGGGGGTSVAAGPAGDEPLIQGTPGKALPAPLMARLAREREDKRKAIEPDLKIAEDAGATQDVRKAALLKIAPVLYVKLDGSLTDLGAFDPKYGWAEQELKLQFDHLPPELEADPGVKAEKASYADILVATRTLAAAYEPLFQRTAKVAGTFKDLQFAEDFKAQFKKILADAFPDPKTLTPEGLAVLLSPAQRAMLADFFRTKVIPDGLFTGAAATGTATVQQKILMSAEILASGHNKEKRDGDAASAPGKPRAQFCGHWANWVFTYAGVNPAAGSPAANEGNNLGVVGPTGQTSFGGGETDKTVSKMGKLNPDGSGQRMPVGHPDAAKMELVFSTLKPGDWIFIDNGGAAGHSEVFAGWDKPDEEPKEGSDKDKDGNAITVRYKKAHVYSQRDNGGTEKERWNKPGGGDFHGATLGYPYSKALGVDSVTAITRPTADSGPPRTAEQLLHFNRDAAPEKNLDQIKRYALFHGAQLDLGKYRAQLAASAQNLLATSPFLQNFEPAQRALCEKIIADSADPNIFNISTLIALVQRLSVTKDHAGRDINGVIDFAKKGDVALLGSGGTKAIEKDKAATAEKPGSLDFAADQALERNRVYTKRLAGAAAAQSPETIVARLTPMVAAAVADVKGKLKGKQKDKYDKEHESFDALFESHKAGTTLADLSALIALWQFEKGSGVSGWVEKYESIIGGDKLKELKKPAEAPAPKTAN